MSRFDTKLKHVLNNWMFAKGANHEIRLKPKEHNITDFEKLLTYNGDLLLLLRRTKNSVSILLIKQKVKLILDVIHYSEFMYNNGDDTTTENQTQ